MNITTPAASVARPCRGLHGHLVEELGLLITGAPPGVARLATEGIRTRHLASRTAVRESLRTLEAKGLIASRPNSGTWIRPVSEWSLLDPQVLAWRAQGPNAADQAREMAQLSASLEPLIADLAARRADQIAEPARGKLAALADRLVEFGEREDRAAFAEADRELHTLLAEESGNALLQHLAGMLHHQMASGGELCPVDADSGIAHAALVEHVLAGEARYAESVARGEISRRRNQATNTATP